MNRVVLQNGRADEVFEAIRVEWQNLFATADCSPFLSWDWMSTWFKSFGGSKTPILLKAYKGEEIIGILPMFIEKTSFLGMRFQSLALMGSGPGGADYLGAITTPGDPDGAVSSFLTFIQRELKVDRMSLEHLDSTSDFARQVKSAFAPRSNHVTCPDGESICPQIDLSEGWEDILSHSKRKSNFKRRLKKLEQMEGFEFRSVTAPTEMRAAFERFLDLHNRRWHKQGGSELSGHPRLISFQRGLVAALSNSKLLRFDELWVEGQCRGSAYALEHRGIYYYYNSGYDGDYAHLSVGLVLLGLSIKHAIARGNTVYDFLRGDETYKFDWANRRTTLVSIELKGKKFPLLAQEWTGGTAKALRGISKSALPAGFYETLGNWRRSWRRSYLMSGK